MEPLGGRGEAFAQITAVFSALELRTTKARAAGVMAARRRRGDDLGRVGYGFRRIRDERGALVDVPDPKHPIGGGVLHAVVVNTTANGAITIADSVGPIAVLKASVAEQTFFYDAMFSGRLDVTLAANSDVTVLTTPSLPSSYAP